MQLSDIHFDCKYFKGTIPCKYNKIDGSECPNCTHYEKISKKILIIKLGAIGDVIRTTPLVVAYKKKYPQARFTWVTLYPDILPKDDIDEIYKLDAVSIMNVTSETFDIAINLDKDKEACILLSKVSAKEKYGFEWKNEHLNLATPKALHKVVTGLFDAHSQKNTKTYLEEIFEICHLTFQKENYLIRTNTALKSKWENLLKEKSNGKKIIGLNTGCGARWHTRLWPQDYWVEYIKTLQEKGMFCMVLGGKDEDEQNKYYAQQTGAYYPGHYSLEEFIAITNTCDLIVTQVSMMMHIATALKKKLLLMNNIFNAHEFELYDRGIIVQPSSGCDCFYGTTCKRDKSCMYDISVEVMQKKLLELLHA